MRSTVPVVLSLLLVAAAPALAATIQVNISGFAFSPATAAAAPGDDVRWTNLDGALHTATSFAVPAHFDTGTLGSGASSIKTFASIGTYPYWCNFHKTSMRGVVQVGANTAPSPTISLATGSTVSGVVTLSGTVADAEGPDTWVRVKVGTTQILGSGTIHGLGAQTAAGTHAWSVNWDTTTVPNGPYTIQVLGSDGSHPEVTISISVTVANTGLLPDLVVQNVVSTGLWARQMSAGIKNIGPGFSSATTVEFAIYRPDLTREVVGTATLPALAPNGSHTVSVPWDATNKFGTYTIEAVADPANAVAEADEANNVRQAQSAVLIPGPPHDLDDL